MHHRFVANSGEILTECIPRQPQGDIRLVVVCTKGSGTGRLTDGQIKSTRWSEAVWC